MLENTKEGGQKIAIMFYIYIYIMSLFNFIEKAKGQKILGRLLGSKTKYALERNIFFLFTLGKTTIWVSLSAKQ